MAGYYQSPMGWFRIHEQEGKLHEVAMVDSIWLNASPTPLEQEAIAQLRAYFEGKLKKFDLPYFLGHLSPFSLRVFELLTTEVGYGKQITYGQLAKLAHSAGAARAVGRAMASNPITIVVPCHRVVASHGLGGYAWSTAKKAWLLHHEASHLG